MAVTITAQQLAAATDASIETATRLLPVATARAMNEAPGAPDVMLNEACIRYAGYLASAPGFGRVSQAGGRRHGLRDAADAWRGVAELRRRRVAVTVEDPPGGGHLDALAVAAEGGDPRLGRRFLRRRAPGHRAASRRQRR